MVIPVMWTSVSAEKNCLHCVMNCLSIKKDAFNANIRELFLQSYLTKKLYTIA